jgi:ribosomal protein S27AE
MKKLLQRILFILFCQSLFFLSIFYVNEAYYAQWTVGFVLLLFISVFLSFRIIPTQKKTNRLKELSQDYLKNMDEAAEIKKSAMQLELTCPNCEKSSNYWSYLEDYHCEKCGSGLWSTEIKKKPKEYTELFGRREGVKQYMDRLSPGTKRALKKYILNRE